MEGEYVGKSAFNSTTFGKSLSLRVDGGVNAVSINPSGRDVVLANKQGLLVVDLDDPFQPPRLLHHLTAWQVADVQWSPHQSKPYWVISTSNQKAMVWNLSRGSSNAIEHVLHGHSRAITDINFHPDHPEILATCSIDTYILAWDMRSPQAPYFRTADWRAGASQVKWNIKNPNVLASSHADYVCLWDVRKGTTPLYKLSGHTSSVNNISFDSKNESRVMTSSNDGTVKFWDYESNHLEPIKTVVTDFPVWRGRYLPFGVGSCIIPMVEGDNGIYLMNHDNFDEDDQSETKLQPIYVFKGHKDRVTDFLWRARHTENTDIDDREFQLVTWSKDSDLRLWPIPNLVYEKVGFSRKEKLENKLPDFPYDTYRTEPVKTKAKSQSAELLGSDLLYEYPRERFVSNSASKAIGDEKDRIDHLAWLSGVRVINEEDNNGDFLDTDDNYGVFSSTYKNLGEEFSAVGHKFPKIGFEKISVSTGELVITLNGPWNTSNKEELIFLRVEVNFPKHYPKNGQCPCFHIEENRELSQEIRQEIDSTLKEISEAYCKKERHCLEACLRYLLGEKFDSSILNQEDEGLVDFDVMKKLGLDDDEWANDQVSINEKIENNELFHQDDFDNLEDDTQEKQNSTLMNNGFDSTPVPKGCGAVWTARGQLVCFFATSAKSEKQQKVKEQLFKFSASGARGFGNFKILNKTKKMNVLPEKGDEIKQRPKTYLETLEQQKSTRRRGSSMHEGSEFSIHSASEYDSSECSDSDEDSDEDQDDWGTVLDNDLTFRTKIPMIAIKAPSVTDAFSEGGKTNDSFKINKNIVCVHDFSSLLPDSINLALNYRLMGEDREILCKYNASVAEQFGLEDIGACWRLVSDMLMSQSKDIFNHQDWCFDSHGGQMFIKQIIKYFEMSKNIQMLAMLACLLVTPGISKHLENKIDTEMVESVISYGDANHSNSNGFPSPNGLPSPQYSKSLPADNASIRSENYFNYKESHALPTSRQPSIATSHSGDTSVMFNEFEDAYNLLPEIKVEVLATEIADSLDTTSLSLLDPKDEIKLRNYRHQYAELLYLWGLPVHRVKILKFNVNHNTELEFLHTLRSSDSRDIYKGVESQWMTPTSGLSENKSVAYAKIHNCSMCETPIKRRIFVCSSCQHVMHTKCSNAWWENNQECPRGCGCQCI